MAHNRIEWLSLLRALNIVLVVMFHVVLIDIATGDNHPFCSLITAPLLPVRMPLFIFISGGLLFTSRIAKGWGNGALYVDKLKRIMVPFLFFVTALFAFKAALNSLVKTPVDLSFSSFVESFFVYYGHPSKPLWFLAALMLMMLCYPLFVRTCRSTVAMIAVAVVSVVAYFHYPEWLQQHNYFCIGSINRYFPFFYFGILFFRYSLYRWLDSILVLALLVAAYVLLMLAEVPLLTSIVGILMMCSLAMVLARYIKRGYHTIGDYIYQIYLMSIFFQGFVEIVLWKMVFYNEQLFALFYLLNVAAGVAMPIVVAKLVERCPWRALRLCFGLK